MLHLTSTCSPKVATVRTVCITSANNRQHLWYKSKIDNCFAYCLFVLYSISLFFLLFCQIQQTKELFSLLLWGRHFVLYWACVEQAQTPIGEWRSVCTFAFSVHVWSCPRPHWSMNKALVLLLLLNFINIYYLCYLYVMFLYETFMIKNHVPFM